MIGSITQFSGALTQSSDTLDRSLSRLGSGKRVNTAADDAAGLAIAMEMAGQQGSVGQAQQNVNYGVSVVQTAGGALGQVSDTLQQMRDLAAAAANGTNSTSDRQAYAAQFSQLAGSLDAISTQTQFNGQSLLDGTFSTAIQSGPNAGDTTPLALGSVASSALGVAGLDITTAAGAGNALSAIDQALGAVGTQQANVGAAQSALNAAAVNLSGTYQNLAAAKSRIVDTNYAAESANAASANVQQQASLQAISLYNANQSNVLTLLPGSNSRA